MLIDDKHKAIFIHIPKTGGMSVEKAMGRRHQNSHHHFGRREIKRAGDKWNDYFKFAFVRNPYTRVYSAFQYNIKMIEESGMNQVRKIIRDDCDLDFEKFILFGLQKVLQLRVPRWFTPQHRYVKLDFDFIGRFENFENDFLYVKEKIGLENDLPHINKSTSEGIFFTKEMYEIVNEVYRKDFFVFGYEMKYE